MKKLSVTQFRNKLAKILNQVSDSSSQFIIERRGKPAAIILSPSNFRELSHKNIKEGANPSLTAGEFSLSSGKYDINDIFKAIKEPNNKKSLLGR